MNKAELLRKCNLPDAFLKVMPLENTELTGWIGDSSLFKKLLQEKQPKLIIEVGSWLGLSTATMSQALFETGLQHDTSLLAIDTWLGSQEHWEGEGIHDLQLKNGYPTLYERFLSNMKVRGFDSCIVPLPMTSQTAARFLKKKHIMADLIYIDGSHNEKDVYEDLVAYYALLNDGGIVFGDDYQWPSVSAAVKKFCAEYRLEISVIDINWIIRKPLVTLTNTPITPNTTTTTHAPAYIEPELTYVVLDFNKEAETRSCLRSIKEHTKFPHKIIYLHNGIDGGYAYSLFKEGLVDHFIQTKENTGLGIGTRNLFASSFSPYTFYLQNDQTLKRTFTQAEFDTIKSIIGCQYRSPLDGSSWTAASVDVAGAFCGTHIYSERGHIIQTDFYKMLETTIPLGYFGAGPWHQDPWREEQIQTYYKEKKYLHYSYNEPLVEDNGHNAIRENVDGSIWEQRTDSQELRLIKGPVSQIANYPHFTQEEWQQVLSSQSWPEWQVPENDRKNRKP